MASKPEVSPVYLYGPVRLHLVIMTEIMTCQCKLPAEIKTFYWLKKMKPFSDISLHNELMQRVDCKFQHQNINFNNYTM